MILVIFQSELNVNQFQFLSVFGNLPRLQPYVFATHSLLSSLFNLQSTEILSILVQLKHNIMTMAHYFVTCGQISSLFNLHLLSASVRLRHFSGNTRIIRLLFSQTLLSFTTFRSAITLTEFQFWSFLGKIPRL